MEGGGREGGGRGEEQREGSERDRKGEGEGNREGGGGEEKQVVPEKQKKKKDIHAFVSFVSRSQSTESTPGFVLPVIFTIIKVPAVYNVAEPGGRAKLKQ